MRKWDTPNLAFIFGASHPSLGSVACDRKECQTVSCVPNQGSVLLPLYVSLPPVSGCRRFYVPAGFPPIQILALAGLPA